MKGPRNLWNDSALARVMEWFSRNPGKRVYVNELSRLIHLSNASCSRSLNLLEKKKILEMERIGKAHYYRLIDNYATRELKRFFFILRLHGSGLVEHLSENNPSMTNLILYGSCATGEYDENSDIDLLAINNGQITADLDTYQDKLETRIEITSMNIGKWLALRRKNNGFYQEIRRRGIALIGGELP